MNNTKSSDQLDLNMETYEKNGHHIEIIIEDDAWCQLSNSFEFLAMAAVKALEVQSNSNPKNLYEIAIMLSTNAHVKYLNKTYRNKNKSTNVLSFPINENINETSNDGLTHIGDIILAHDTIMKEAQQEGKKPKDHIIHLIIHGVLHLLGYDHEDEHDAQDMEKEESRLMLALGLRDPYDTAVN